MLRNQYAALITPDFASLLRATPQKHSSPIHKTILMEPEIARNIARVASLLARAMQSPGERIHDKSLFDVSRSGDADRRNRLRQRTRKPRSTVVGCGYPPTERA